MPTILDEILEDKRRELEAARARVPEHEMAERANAVADSESGRPRGFRRALETAARPAVIAELKGRSPSKGLIRANFDPVACARAYASGGAAEPVVGAERQRRVVASERAGAGRRGGGYCCGQWCER